jgi:hypothetical protein
MRSVADISPAQTKKTGMIAINPYKVFNTPLAEACYLNICSHGGKTSKYDCILLC